MMATAEIVNRMAELLGADTVTLAAPTTFVALHLAKEPFTPGPNLELTDLVEADFDGYVELHAASAATQVYTDPQTGETIIQVREPAGGWFWETSGETNLPQTIHGVYLTSPDGLTLHASGLFDQLGLPAVALTGTGQGLSWPQATLRLATIPLS